MKVFTSMFVAVIMSVLVFATSASAAYNVEVISGVNFRSKPSVNSTVYRFLSKGTDVKVLSKVNKYWLKVSVNGKTGYISALSKFTRKVGTTTATGTSTSTSATSKASKIVATAKSYIGDFKYKFGAEPWNTGYRYSDCSAFVQLVFNKKHGYSLPRTSRAQAKAGKYVSKSNLKPGDLVFFDTTNNGIVNHVGIYIGSGKFIHSSPINKVGTSDLSTGYWKNHYKTGRRVV
ncbi:SH3 domain-containing C40 family peptidase [Paenibacillus thermotolerans]|uniref:C40 family peptidase n=1 Tax=Paenibacillus thermotolerans TaxID=3027807 RepID=UPI002368DF00|nr:MULTISPECIES: SH3 domain-containing C40 family peptidase [unclassified Paenibacillus]